MWRMAVLEGMRLSRLPCCIKQTSLFNPFDTYLPADCCKEYHCMILMKNLICNDTVLERDSGRQHAVAKEGDIAGSSRISRDQSFRVFLSLISFFKYYFETLWRSKYAFSLQLHV